MPTQTADITVGFTADDMRRLRAAAKSCRLSLEEFIRLTMVGATRGVQEVRDRV